MRPGITPGGSFAAADGFMFVVTMHETDFRSYATRSSCPMCPTIRASLPAICATSTSRSSWQRCPRGSDATPLPSSRGDSVRPGSCTRGSTTISSSFAILTWRRQASHLDRATGCGPGADPASAWSRASHARVTASDGAFARSAPQGDPRGDRPGVVTERARTRRSASRTR